MLMNDRKRDVTSPELSNFSLKKFLFDACQLSLQIWDTPIRSRLSCNSFKPCSIRKNHGLTFCYCTSLISFPIRVLPRNVLIAFCSQKLPSFKTTSENYRALKKKLSVQFFRFETLARSFAGNNSKKIAMFSTEPLCCCHWSFGQQLL